MPPSSETDSSTLNEDNSNTTTNKIVNKDTTNTSALDHNEDTDAQASLLRLTRRHSLPASYHLSNFLSFFNQNSDSTHESSNLNEAHVSSKTLPQVNANTTRHARSATASGLVGQTTPRSSVNRHRYGHRHTRSVVDQPVVVRTYNPPATPRVPTRAGMMNPAIFEVCSWLA